MICSVSLFLSLVSAPASAAEGLAQIQKMEPPLSESASKACYVVSQTFNSVSGMGCANNAPCVLSSIKLICDADVPAYTNQEFVGAYTHEEHAELHHRVVTTSNGTMVGLGKRIVSCDPISRDPNLNLLVTDCLLQDD